MSASRILFGLIVAAAGWLTLLCDAKTCRADDPKDFKTVVKELARTLINSNTTGKPLRLAVITFLPTKGGVNLSNEFGEYITESLISELTSGKKSFRLFERKRLDEVLKENDLMLSDLMDQRQAIKVGELLPIDAIFSGSYTRLKKYIDINSRLIDVVTGEIIVSFSGRIQWSDELAELFPDATRKDNKDQSDDVSKTDRCKQNAQNIRTLLNDLTADSKIQNVVNEAVKIPYDNDCGQIHNSVMSYFIRYKIDSAPYKQFLIKTLDTISYPSNDYRARDILYFLASDTVIDEQEWKVALKTIEKSQIGAMDNIFQTLYRNIIKKGRIAEQFTRIDEYFERVQAQKVGLPIPVNYNSGFFAATRGLKSEDDVSGMAYCYERYGFLLNPMDPVTGTTSKSLSANVYALLVYIYQYGKTDEIKGKAMKWLTAHFNNLETSEESSKQLYDFIRFFELTSNENTNRRIQKEFPAKDLDILVRACKPKFTEWATLTPYTNQLEDRLIFCAANDIPVPGFIPTMEETAQRLTAGTDWKEMVRVMKLLERMKDRPKSIESALLQVIAKKDIEHKKELTDIQRSAIVVLGNIRSEHSQAIHFMIESLTSYEYGVADKSKEALTKIGKAAVPYLIDKLRSLSARDDALEYQIIVVLGLIGRDARAAKPDLQKILQRTTHQQRRYAIEAAIQAME